MAYSTTDKYGNKVNYKYDSASKKYKVDSVESPAYQKKQAEKSQSSNNKSEKTPTVSVPLKDNTSLQDQTIFQDEVKKRNLLDSQGKIRRGKVTEYNQVYKEFYKDPQSTSTLVRTGLASPVVKRTGESDVQALQRSAQQTAQQIARTQTTRTGKSSAVSVEVSSPIKQTSILNQNQQIPNNNKILPPDSVFNNEVSSRYPVQYSNPASLQEVKNIDQTQPRFDESINFQANKFVFGNEKRQSVFGEIPLNSPEDYLFSLKQTEAKNIEVGKRKFLYGGDVVERLSGAGELAGATYRDFSLSVASGVYAGSVGAVVDVVKNPIGLIEGPVRLAESLVKKPADTLGDIGKDLARDPIKSVAEIGTFALLPKVVGKGVQAVKGKYLDFKGSNILRKAEANIPKYDYALNKETFSNNIILENGVSISENTIRIGEQQSTLGGGFISDVKVKELNPVQKVIVGKDDLGSPIYGDARNIRTEVNPLELPKGTRGAERYETSAFSQNDLITIKDVKTGKEIYKPASQVSDFISDDPARYRVLSVKENPTSFLTIKTQDSLTRYINIGKKGQANPGALFDLIELNNQRIGNLIKTTYVEAVEPTIKIAVEKSGSVARIGSAVAFSSLDLSKKDSMISGKAINEKPIDIIKIDQQSNTGIKGERITAKSTALVIAPEVIIKPKSTGKSSSKVVTKTFIDQKINNDVVLDTDTNKGADIFTPRPKPSGGSFDDPFKKIGLPVLPKVRNSSSSLDVGEKGFDVFSARGEKLNPRSLIKSEALSFGADLVDKSALASFRLEKSSQSARRGYTGNNLGILSKFDINNNRYVEKSKFRIDTAGELGDITYSPKNVRVKKKKGDDERFYFFSKRKSKGIFG